MLRPSAAYAHSTDTYVSEGTSQVAYNVVANSEITTWDQVAKEIAKQMNTFTTDINVTYKGQWLI